MPAAFVKRQASATQGLATGDLDGNGKDELIADFGALGLWALYNNAAALGEVGRPKSD